MDPADSDVNDPLPVKLATPLPCSYTDTVPLSAVIASEIQRGASYPPAPIRLGQIASCVEFSLASACVPLIALIDVALSIRRTQPPTRARTPMYMKIEKGGRMAAPVNETAPAPSRFTGEIVRYPSLYCLMLVCMDDPVNVAADHAPFASCIGPVAFASQRLLDFQGSANRLGSVASDLGVAIAGASGAGYGGGCETPDRRAAKGLPEIHDSARSCTSPLLKARPYSCTSDIAPVNPDPVHDPPPIVSLRGVEAGRSAHPVAAAANIPFAYRSASSLGGQGADVGHRPDAMLTTGCVQPCAPDVPVLPSNRLYPIPAFESLDVSFSCTREESTLLHETHPLRYSSTPSAKSGSTPSHGRSASVSSQSVAFSEGRTRSCASTWRTYVAIVMFVPGNENRAVAVDDPSNKSVATGTAGGAGGGGISVMRTKPFEFREFNPVAVAAPLGGFRES